MRTVFEGTLSWHGFVLPFRPALKANTKSSQYKDTEEAQEKWLFVWFFGFVMDFFVPLFFFVVRLSTLIGLYAFSLLKNPFCILFSPSFFNSYHV